MKPTQRLILVAIASVCLTGWPLAVMTSAAFAQSKSERISLADSRKALGDGKAAVEASNFAEGVRLLDVAINSKRLSHRELARALYHRGLGYRGQGEIAKAVSDLTAALWMKNGLSKEERDAALAARASAYQSAGLSAQGQSAASTSSPSSTPSSSATSGATASLASPSSPEAWSSSMQINSQSASGGDALGTGISNFFGSLFGGGSSSDGGAGSSTATGAIPTPAPAQPAAVSGWSSSAGGSDRPAATAASGGTSAAGGGVRVQVAAMRAQSDASNLANRLTSQLGGSLQGGSVRVTDKTIGSMGKFYLVEIGPFRSTEDTTTICAQLKRDGLDCHLLK